MPIIIVDHVAALLGHLRPEDIERLPPVERRRLADRCKHVAALAEGKAKPRPGILSELHRNEQRHE